MPEIALEVLIILVLILVNGLLAMAEIAIVSVRKARLQQRVSEGDKKAQVALDLASEPSDTLSTIQIGITLVGIFAGAFGGATFARYLTGVLAEIPALARYSGALSLAIVVVLITYFNIVLGELVPKRWALNNPEGVALRVAPPMRTLTRLTLPLVRLLSASSDLILRLVGAKQRDEPPVTEDEIKFLIGQGTQAGIFEEAEQDMVRGVFRLGDRRVGTLMTPRPEIVWLNLADPSEANQKKIIESVHTRFPVARGDLDDIQGVVQAKDLLPRSLAGEPFDLECCLEKPLFVPESMPALKVLEVFKESGLQLVMVIDEFGGMQGLVTLDDILQAIVGDIPVSGELNGQEAVQREDGSWLLDGMLPVDEFNEIFRVTKLPNEEKGYFQTLSGFVMDFLGRIPTTGDSFEWNRLRFEIVDMDGFRVDKVLVVPLPGEQPGTGAT